MTKKWGAVGLMNGQHRVAVSVRSGRQVLARRSGNVPPSGSACSRNGDSLARAKRNKLAEKISFSAPTMSPCMAMRSSLGYSPFSSSMVPTIS